MSQIESFRQFYENFYGGRWASIEKALGTKPFQCARINLFAGASDASQSESADYHDLPFCKMVPEDFKIPRSESNVLRHYVMDPASILAAQILPLKEADAVLDMCAAPGGKSLILAERLRGQNAELWCNELSMARRERLTKVLQNYIPQQERQSLWVKGLDATKYGIKFPKKFQSILLDAPCSGERHLLEDAAEFEKWKPNWSKKNAQRQFALLTSADLALMEGGSLLYSTCALSPLENDEVVEKFLERRPHMRITPLEDELEPIHIEFVRKYGEPTRFGFQFLPDRCGFGPFYFSLMKSGPVLE